MSKQTDKKNHVAFASLFILASYHKRAPRAQFKEVILWLAYPYGFDAKMIRQILLKASANGWLRRNATSLPFLRRSVRRFLPGETLDDALAASAKLAEANLGTVLTCLGENVSNRDEARGVAEHYRVALARLRSCDFPVEISVKLTQLGLDLDPDFCLENFVSLLPEAPPGSTVWIDMEQSAYVDRTLNLVKRARAVSTNVGVCVQAYLRRTAEDVHALIADGTAVRLVKGAYAEQPEIAFPKKSDVDENYFRLAAKLLGPEARQSRVRAALATHDGKLIDRIIAWAQAEGLKTADLEFQMLYGIQTALQRQLVARGFGCRVLISYGSYWYPWFMRRLAERPANLFFLARNLFARGQ